MVAPLRKILLSLSSKLELRQLSNARSNLVNFVLILQSAWFALKTQNNAFKSLYSDFIFMIIFILLLNCQIHSLQSPYLHLKYKLNPTITVSRKFEFYCVHKTK